LGQPDTFLALAAYSQAALNRFDERELVRVMTDNVTQSVKNVTVVL
jgi:hypothetical protein